MYIILCIYIHFLKAFSCKVPRDSRCTDDIYIIYKVYTRQLLYIFCHLTRFVFNHTGLLCYTQQCQSLLKVTSSDFSEINLVIFCYDFYIIFICGVLNLYFICILNFKVSENTFVSIQLKLWITIGVFYPLSPIWRLELQCFQF